MSSGGDEFAILVDQLSDSKQIYFLVKRIFKALEQPYTIEGKEVEINVSIGVATFPECAQDAVEFMKCADVAMYRAKAAGRNQAQYYSKDFHKQMNARVNTEIDLKKAIKKKQFVLYYQPQISTRDHRVVGVEALIRWQHPTRGMLHRVISFRLPKNLNVFLR